MILEKRKAFEDLLRLDENIGLTAEQVRQVALMLTVAGATPPLPVWTTLDEVRNAPGGTLVEDPSEQVFQLRRLTGYWWEMGYGQSWAPEEISLPVMVRWLP